MFWPIFWVGSTLAAIGLPYITGPAETPTVPDAQTEPPANMFSLERISLYLGIAIGVFTLVDYFKRKGK